MMNAMWCNETNFPMKNFSVADQFGVRTAVCPDMGSLKLSGDLFSKKFRRFEIVLEKCFGNQ